MKKIRGQKHQKEARKDLSARLRQMAAAGGDRHTRAKQIAGAIRDDGAWRWVGVYDVDEQMVSILAWSEPGAPAHPSFPVGKGLTGAAIQERKTVVVGDVRIDPRYLTAFGSTLSEIIVPVLHPSEGRVIGTIDVESEKASAFSAADQQKLERYAQAAMPLWLDVRT